MQEAILKMDSSDDSLSFDRSNDRIMPYQYEPVLDENSENENTDESSTDWCSESDSSEVVDEFENWCHCDQCVNMPTQSERKCCKTANIINDKAEEMKCITEHEWFKVNCLNIHALETSYYDYVLGNGPMEENQRIHELYRHLAYRRFTRWIYGLLGRKCRRVIPACTVSAIRTQFPSEEYCGFEYPQ